MELQIQSLRKEDFRHVISFAIRGMHFDEYLNKGPLLRMYGTYFWYLELQRASQVIAAYAGDTLAGVLLADMKGEKKAWKSAGWNLYVKLIDWFQNTFYKDGVRPYDQANAEMLKAFTQKYSVDGEICFLAANPDLQIHGIGTCLLKELERREKGKRIYLYTDNNCTYQFYEHRGFEKAGERRIDLGLKEKGDVPLECFLFSKVCQAE